MNRIRPFRNRKRSGFSLIEVTLALGLLVFALVAIISLLPVALKSSSESERETQATLIAQNIFSDLASGYSPTNTFITIGEDLREPAGRTLVNLADDSDYCVLYTVQGKPLGLTTPADFLGTQAADNVVYGAKIVIRKNPASTNLSRVEVQVEVPVGAPTKRRTRYNFVTELRNR